MADTQQILDDIKRLLEDKKGEDIQVIDVREKEYLVDFVVIATAMAGKHSFALLDFLKTELKPKGVEFYATDEESEDWLIADLGFVMVHIFTQNHRNKFNLEEFLQGLPKKA
ncbi:ribosome silencing factor [Helicobacter himalayensis]|uniref:ribosome silencing factor n=1 Tax=Helicobacter himalayensis TaxID=1591088 RepID=UPI000834296E|nr:ribosome silencing factor [Helicobacter himalayensis]